MYIDVSMYLTYIFQYNLINSCQILQNESKIFATKLK